MKSLRVLMLVVLILASFASTEGKQQNIQQNANVNNEIKGGHHNTINTDIDQTSQIGDYDEGEEQNTKQNANVNSKIKGGHHNTIDTDIDQVSQIGVGNKNKVPYGQLKKAYGFDEENDLAESNLNQVMDIDSLINGGHHNTILVDGKQVAFLGKSKNSALNPAEYMTDLEKLSLNQEASIFSQIFGGHHNTIMVGSTQQAEIEPFASGTLIGNINQIEDINSQIFGGHHNTIIVDASQTARTGSIANEV